ncbi:hypothetical protein M3202_10805 [Alkalihalobacillus oceani]|uniref:Uncharacterized protein n=1 Tax=Halalkalibacter oceani TaxID=1653776 RepID=A0A9X2DPA0_9BACI|nr:hypothetical protein [Halalkalibacter oceani]MCM3714579.1 hypothetical protein [Halalkalibacter oceani]
MNVVPHADTNLEAIIFAGEGEEADPFLIEAPEKLAEIRNHLNSQTLTDPDETQRFDERTPFHFRNGSKIFLASLSIMTAPSCIVSACTETIILSVIVLILV